MQDKLLTTLYDIYINNELINNYYTPFIKYKLNNKEINYEKEIKELDKQIDRIKQVYIKGILKIEDFEKEIKQIEINKETLIKKQNEQNKYESLEFNADDLLIIKDYQEINLYKNPLSFIEKINYIKNISREEKQRLFASYIDFIEISKRGKKIKIENINFRKAFISDLITYDKEYNIPLNLPLFKDDYGLNINMSIKPITTKKAELYFKKLQNILGSNYKLNFYTSSFNNQTEDFTFKIDNELEKNNKSIYTKR